MSRPNRNSRLAIANDLDVTLAKIGLLACILLLSLRLFAEQVLLVVIPVAGATAFGVYILTRTRQIRVNEMPTLSGEVTGYLPAMTFLALAILVLQVRFAAGRTLLTHFTIGLIGSLVLMQILFTTAEELRVGLLLLQILVVALITRLAAVLSVPGYVGVDIWTHGPIFIQSIADDGSITAIADSKYVMAPIYHLNGAIATEIYGSPEMGIYLSLGILVTLSAGIIYAISRLLLPVRWALLATALYAFSDQFIRWGIHVIPTSFGVVFFLGALFCLTKLYFVRDGRFLLLLLVCSLAVVFTHQVSTAAMLLALGIASLATLGIRFTPYVEAVATTARIASGIAVVFLVSVVVTLVSWAHTPFSEEFIFLWRMLEILELQLTEEAGFLNLASETPDAATATPIEPDGPFAQVVPFVEWFGFSLLLMLTVIGGIVFLRWRATLDVRLMYVLVTIAMFVVIYGFSLFGLRTFMPGRWLVFLYAPMAILGALGLYFVSRNAQWRLVVAVFLLVAMAYPMSMAVAEKSTLDNPVFEDEYPRFAYTETELAALETIVEIQGPAHQETIETDHPYRSLFDRVGDYEIADLQLENGEPNTTAAVVSRSYQHEGAASVFQAGAVPIQQPSHLFLEESICTANRHVVYSNDDVTFCPLPAAQYDETPPPSRVTEETS